MLRTIISLYKVTFLIICGLMLMTAILFGFGIMIEGQTSSERWEGVSLMFFGSLFVLMVAGNFALVIENNELLRLIAGQGGKGQHLHYLDTPPGSEKRSEPVIQRREPRL